MREQSFGGTIMGGGRLCKGEGLLAGFVGGGSDLCDFQCPKKDVENQAGNAAVAQRLAEFQRDPKAWLGPNFNSAAGWPPDRPCPQNGRGPRTFPPARRDGRICVANPH